eukprot:scaffold36642_cov50-Phaeocystis_antarctica.AAC.1
MACSTLSAATLYTGLTTRMLRHSAGTSTTCALPPAAAAAAAAGGGAAGGGSMVAATEAPEMHRAAPVVCIYDVVEQRPHVCASCVYYSPLTTHHSRLTTHHSQLTTHHSRLTTDHPLPTTYVRASGLKRQLTPPCGMSPRSASAACSRGKQPPCQKE